MNMIDLRSDTHHLDHATMRHHVDQELRRVRDLGRRRATLRASANLGAYEFILLLIRAGERGLPFYATLDQIESQFATRSGLVKRISDLRREGLITATVGDKRSQVLLRPSDELLADLTEILSDRSPPTP